MPSAPPRPVVKRSTHALLGALTPKQFLRAHWQKQHRVIRQAIPGFTSLLTPSELFALAERDDMESRLIVRHGATWQLSHGPFRRRDLKSLPARNWTLLVQGVNLVVPAAEALLRQFSFIPYARLDDVMVSYAAAGGGVGPHFDSYDVFLLQGSGRRRWRVGTQDDLELKADLPLKILRRFRPEHEWVLEPGDMLYLPPRYAHDGVALDACMTYSIGFRTPSAQELTAAWLDHLRDRLPAGAHYGDPDLTPTATPAHLSPRLVARCRALVQASVPGLVHDANEFACFVGVYLTEPKVHIFFTLPATPLTPPRFAARARTAGVVLDARTQMLYDGKRVYINGTAEAMADAEHASLRTLANRRSLPPTAVSAVTARLDTWYRSGYLHLASGS